MSPNKPSQSGNALKSVGKKLVQAGLAATALFGGINKAEAETHKGVMTVVGAGFGSTTGHAINVDFNAANPAASIFTADERIIKGNTQAAADAMDYDHIIGDRFVMTHEPKGKTGNAAGLHLYWNIGGKIATTSNLQFNGSNVEDFNTNDQFLFSEGDTPDQDQIIAQSYDENDQLVIKSYKLLKDENGKPTGMKLLGKTNLPSDVGNQIRVFKNVLSATSNTDANAWSFKENADGTWSQQTKIDFSKEGVSAWAHSDRKPIFPTPSGINITLPASNGVVRANADLSSYKEIEGGTAERSFGEGNKYRIRYDNNKSFIIENTKGETGALAGDLKMMIHGGISQISKNPEAFVAMGYGQYILLTITSESPLQATANIFPNDLISKNYNKSNHYIVEAGTDKDGDRVHSPYDNAPNVPNASQIDSDKDGLGDAQDISPGVAGFSQNELLSDSGFRFLCNPGKISVGAIPGGGENISFANMAVGDTSTIQLIGQEKSNNSKLTITVPAGFEITANIIDGGVKANGAPLTSTMTTSASTILTLDAFSNVAFTFTNLGIVAPADIGSTEKDAGSSPDTDQDAGSTGTDAASTDTTEQDAAGKPDTEKADTGTDAGTPPNKDAGSTGTDAASTDNGTPNGADAGNTGKPDAGSTGADTAQIGQQPPETGAKTPSGCDANGKPLDPLRTSATLGAAAALILAIRKRAKENGATQEELDKIQ